MKKPIHITISLAGAILLSASSVAAAATVESILVSGRIQWVHSYEEGQKRARENGKPMFVVFRCER